MRQNLLSLLVIFGLMAIGTGCASNLEAHWGEAYRANKTAMIANPDAGDPPDDGVVDLDGATAEGAMDNYRKAQQQAKSRAVPASIVLQGGVSTGK